MRFHSTLLAALPGHPEEPPRDTGEARRGCRWLDPEELGALDPPQLAMFEARYLLGCSAEETAELFHTSKATVDRKVRIARAWLYQRLSAASEGSERRGEDGPGTASAPE